MTSFLILKLFGLAALLMVLYAIFSGRVWGRSWKKYMGGWIYRDENPVIYHSYIFMYACITIASVICILSF